MFEDDDIPAVVDLQFSEFTAFYSAEIPGRNAVADFFLAYWQSLKERALPALGPSRKDISPHDLKQHLSKIVLLDVEQEKAERLYRVRLIGSHVSAHYGEMTNKLITSMENKLSVERVYWCCEKTVTLAAPVLVRSKGYTPQKKLVSSWALYLPLFDPAGHVYKIMICVDVRARKHY